MRPYSLVLDRTVRLLDLPTGDRLTQFDVRGIVQSVAFCARHLAVLRWDRLGIRPRAALDREHLAAHRPVEEDAVFAPAGDLLLSYTRGQALWHWKVESDHVRREGQIVAAGKKPLAFSADGRLLACRGGKGLWIYETARWQLVREIETPIEAIALLFSPDGTALAAAGSVARGERGVQPHSMPIYLWSVADGGLIWTGSGHTRNVGHLAFSPDGQLLASASADKTVRLWDVADGRLVAVCSHQGPVLNQISFNAAGTLLASSDGKAVRLWNRDGSLRQGWSQPHAGVWFLPDDTLLIASTHPDALERPGWPVRHLQVQGVATDLSPDRALLASWSSSDRPGAPGLHVYQVGSGRPLAIDAPPVRVPGTVCGHPHQDLLATGDQDGLVRLLHASTGECATVFPGSLGQPISALQFDPAGQLLAAGMADGRVVLMNVAGGARLQTVAAPGMVDSLSFDRDSRWLAVVREGQVSLYALPGGELVGRFRGGAAAVGPGRTLFVASESGVERHLF